MSAEGRGAVPLPRETADLIGHGQAERLMADAVASGKLPHAWLIAGPRGIGKATLACRLARYVLSGAGERGAGLFGGAPSASLYIPPEDPVFVRVAAGSHPDMLVIERGYNDKGKKRSEIVAGDVGRIAGFLHLTPSLGGWRVVVLDSADEMNPTAANRILKLLEEPPQRALLLLVSHAPGRLLATIRSRCRMVRLGPLPDAAVGELLSRHLPELDRTTAQTLVTLAEGSIGRALSLAADGGIQALEDLFRVLATYPAPRELAVLDLADRWGRTVKTGEADPFATGTALLDWWLGRVARDAAAGEAASAAGAGAGIAGMQEAAGKLLSTLDPAEIVERRAQIAAMLERGTRLYRDKRHMLVEALRMLSPA